MLVYADGRRIMFDRRIKTRDGWVSGVEIIPQGEVSKLSKDGVMDLKTVNEYHVELGYPSKVTTRSTAKALKEQLQGLYVPCKDCAIGEAKQNKVRKETVPRSKQPGERLFHDIISPSMRSIGGSNNWLLVLDDCLDNCWSFFLKKRAT